MLAERVKEEMAAEGLKFMDAHAGYGKFVDINCPIPEARGEMLARHKLTLHMIAALGVKTIAFHTGNENAYPGYTVDTQMDFIKRSLDELLPLAEELGIVICIENIWHQTNTPERLLEVKECFPTDALGFCYDAGHANLMDKGRNYPESNACQTWGSVTPAWDDQILEKMLPHVVNCHLHDNNGMSDQHRNLGDGNIDWQHIAGLLAKAPRLQVIQSEVVLVSANVAIKELCGKFFEIFG
jgi:sugar phosphate isomerase/epimerase